MSQSKKGSNKMSEEQQIEETQLLRSTLGTGTLHGVVTSKAFSFWLHPERSLAQICVN